MSNGDVVQTPAAWLHRWKRRQAWWGNKFWQESDDFFRLTIVNVRYVFYAACMDWDFAIERHRKALLRIVMTLFAMIGLAEGATTNRLAWPLYRAVLRPAEAAVRRLIIAAARDIVVKPRPKRPAPKGLKRKRSGKRTGRRYF